MLLGEPRDATVRELLDPMSRLPHPILNGDGETWALSVVIENIPLRALFSGKGSAIIDEACPKEFELLSLGIPLPGPLFLVLLMLALTLFKGADEATCEVSNGVEVICDLDGGCSSTG
jgi:hypothetical protein